MAGDLELWYKGIMKSIVYFILFIISGNFVVAATDRVGKPLPNPPGGVKIGDIDHGGFTTYTDRCTINKPSTAKDYIGKTIDVKKLPLKFVYISEIAIRDTNEYKVLVGSINKVPYLFFLKQTESSLLKVLDVSNYPSSKNPLKLYNECQINSINDSEIIAAGERLDLISNAWRFNKKTKKIDSISHNNVACIDVCELACD